MKERIVGDNYTRGLLAKRDAKADGGGGAAASLLQKSLAGQPHGSTVVAHNTAMSEFVAGGEPRAALSVLATLTDNQVHPDNVRPGASGDHTGRCTLGECVGIHMDVP